MKKILFVLLTMFCAMPIAASAQVADMVKGDTAVNLFFQGVPMSGTIDEFADALRPHFTLKRKMGSDRNWIFQGYVYGKECPFQVFYTKKTRKVYRVTVMPKNLDANIWLDSLTVDYGTPAETELGYLWQLPQGTVLLRVIEGYDPALILLDKVGQAALKEEEGK